MAVVYHQSVPNLVSTRSNIPMRKVVNGATGAQATAAWDQRLQPGDQIRRHYHDVEETITFLSGRAEVEINGTVHAFDAEIDAAVTVFIPAGAMHTIRNAGDSLVRMIIFFPTPEPAVLYRQEEAIDG